LRFEIPDDSAGAYVLRVRGSYNADDSEGEWQFPFELSADGGASVGDADAGGAGSDEARPPQEQ
jgi:hypothetical protein